MSDQEQKAGARQLSVAETLAWEHLGQAQRALDEKKAALIRDMGLDPAKNYAITKDGVISEC